VRVENRGRQRRFGDEEGDAGLGTAVAFFVGRRPGTELTVELSQRSGSRREAEVTTVLEDVKEAVLGTDVHSTVPQRSEDA
jgi:hypothetical protein